MAWLVAIALLLDLSTTILGLSLGIPEGGPVASRILAVWGVPGYAALEAGVTFSLYYVLRRRAPGWERLAALGPWLASWANAYHILGVLRHG